MRELLSETPNNTPIAYLGDDTTDEKAFKALGENGLKVLVKDKLRPTLADLHLIPPKDLLEFLNQWQGHS